MSHTIHVIKTNAKDAAAACSKIDKYFNPSIYIDVDLLKNLEPSHFQKRLHDGFWNNYYNPEIHDSFESYLKEIAEIRTTFEFSDLIEFLDNPTSQSSCDRIQTVFKEAGYDYSEYIWFATFSVIGAINQANSTYKYPGGSKRWDIKDINLELIQKWIFDEFELYVDCFEDISELHHMCEDLPSDRFTVADFSEKDSHLPVFLVLLDVRV